MNSLLMIKFLFAFLLTKLSRRSKALKSMWNYNERSIIWPLQQSNFLFWYPQARHLAIRWADRSDQKYYNIRCSKLLNITVWQQSLHEWIHGDSAVKSIFESLNHLWIHPFLLHFTKCSLLFGCEASLSTIRNIILSLGHPFLELSLWTWERCRPASSHSQRLRYWSFVMFPCISSKNPCISCGIWLRQVFNITAIAIPHQIHTSRTGQIGHCI